MPEEVDRKVIIGIREEKVKRRIFLEGLEILFVQGALYFFCRILRSMRINAEIPEKHSDGKNQKEQEQETLPFGAFLSFLHFFLPSIIVHANSFTYFL